MWGYSCADSSPGEPHGAVGSFGSHPSVVRSGLPPRGRRDLFYTAMRPVVFL